MVYLINVTQLTNFTFCRLVVLLLLNCLQNAKRKRIVISLSRKRALRDEKRTAGREPIL